MTATPTNGALMYLTSADSVKPTGARTPADALELTSMSTSDDDANQSDDDAVCPECGREFKNQSGMRTHYGHKHEGTLIDTAECEWCGDEFRKPPPRTGHSARSSAGANTDPRTGSRHGHGRLR